MNKDQTLSPMRTAQPLRTHSRCPTMLASASVALASPFLLTPTHSTNTEGEGIKILLSEKVEVLQKPKLSQLPGWIAIQRCLISTSLTPTIF